MSPITLCRRSLELLLRLRRRSSGWIWELFFFLLHSVQLFSIVSAACFISTLRRVRKMRTLRACTIIVFVFCARLNFGKRKHIVYCILLYLRIKYTVFVGNFWRTVEIFEARLAVVEISFFSRHIIFRTCQLVGVPTVARRVNAFCNLIRRGYFEDWKKLGRKSRCIYTYIVGHNEQGRWNGAKITRAPSWK